MTINRLVVSDWSCIWLRALVRLCRQLPRFSPAKTRNLAQHVTVRLVQQLLSPVNLIAFDCVFTVMVKINHGMWDSFQIT